jgi:hypothetical protein
MELSDLQQTKRGFAVVTAALVRTIEESDPSFRARFLARLREAYAEVRDDSPPAANTAMSLEPIAWVGELLTGFEFLADGESGRGGGRSPG